MTAKSHKVLFAGSFNPFTIGHASLVERALHMFDTVVIAVGVNAEKPSTDSETAVQTITELYSGNARVEVTSFTGLAVDAARQNGCCALLRGVRSVADFEYERQMADVNRRVSGLDTVLLFALPEHASISSSIVRELRSYGADVSDMLP